MADGISIGNDLNRFKVVELKEWLKTRGVKTSGKKKADLIKRYMWLLCALATFISYVTPVVSKNV